MADEVGAPFGHDMEARLKGVDRMGSLEIILEGARKAYSQAEKEDMAARKNGYYLDAVAGVDASGALPGAFDALEAVKKAGLKIALASASRNAPQLVEAIGILPYLDAIANPADVKAGKPAPDIFLLAAQLVGAEPEACLGVEDAAAGVAAIKAAGMQAVGVGDASEIGAADFIIADMTAFRLADYL